MMGVRVFLALCLLAVAYAQELATASRNYTLLHRFIPRPNPSSSLPEWSTYGAISLKQEQTRVEGELVVADSRDGVVDDGRGWYQVGVEVGEEMLTSSIRSCYTAAPLLYRFVLSLPSHDLDAAPTALHLDVGQGVKTTGECPDKWFTPGDRLFLPQGIHTQVVIKTPEPIKSIDLAPPPVIDATTGQPAAPVVEKSLLQKYWLPILGVTLFLVSQMGPEPPKQGAAGGAGGGAGAAAAAK